MKKYSYVLVAAMALFFTQAILANTLFQTGTLAAIMSGAYFGSTTYQELQQAGDFGIGTGNGLAGEMVEVSGKFYLANDADGNVHPMPLSMKTPFAMTTKFKASDTFSINNVHGISALKKLINAKLPSNNIYYAVKVIGTFNAITARSVLAPSKKDLHLKLAQLIKKNQRINTYRHVKAELIMFKSPALSAPISVPGYHTHFITTDHKYAGHVYNINIKTAKVKIDPLNRLILQFPTNQRYLKHKIDLKDSGAINKTEKQ